MGEWNISYIIGSPIEHAFFDGKSTQRKKYSLFSNGHMNKITESERVEWGGFIDKGVICHVVGQKRV